MHKKFYFPKFVRVNKISGAIEIRGSGSTLPLPWMLKLMDEYFKLTDEEATL